MWDDTIAAIATPLGEGGLAVIRISGKTALSVADRVFVPVGKSSSKPSAAPSHTIQYGHAMRAGARVDEVLCAVLRAPRTFTREDVVELTCHGGILASKTVLDTVLECGARLAQPGEFTQRAFLNGRIDLAQAEAVADLIHARTGLALSAANEQLAGKLSQRINRLRDELMRTLAHIEAYLDFPEEDIAPDTHAQLIGRLAGAIEWVTELLRTAPEGQLLRRGIRAAIIGRPNAGKSSLLNQLLGHDRAIVSHVPGTTRDTIEETANVRGIPVVFIDTAGLREVQDEIESEGVRRSRAALARAELILHVLDASEPLHEADAQLLREFAGKNRIVIRNKMDLPAQLILPPAVRSHATEETSVESETTPLVDISSKTGAGLEALKEAIQAAVWSGRVTAETAQVTINARHEDALKRAKVSLQLALDALRAEASLEFVALDLRQGINAIGEIVGKTTTEDLLDAVFSQFCIGK
ncbi:MAG: tRNA uridine-5-carboxymethylaminomethyl(34) synthesis GTPase MnmE [Verrucomicrobiae bacterium]|nr:tRNA uridine-5-carboxymethylaminomethyl(34) synthesis GTPase MnmE [Verrucomicrobiae bacterium]